jgi:hypothetical protein
MYTGVNDIMRLDHGPGLSLNEDMLATCLVAPITDQFLAELMAPPATRELICMNQMARTVLLVAMPMIDDIKITMVQRTACPAAWRFPGPTSPAAYAALPPVVAAQQVAVR